MDGTGGWSSGFPKVHDLTAKCEPDYSAAQKDILWEGCETAIKAKGSTWRNTKLGSGRHGRDVAISSCRHRDARHSGAHRHLPPARPAPAAVLVCRVPFGVRPAVAGGLRQGDRRARDA